jgi:hypothetical protein
MKSIKMNVVNTHLHRNQNCSWLKEWNEVVCQILVDIPLRKISKTSIVILPLFYLWVCIFEL